MSRLAPVLLIAFSLATPAAAAVDLEGTWFVLIHYRDSMTANPDADRWEDKVWTIEKKGSRLQWTEYPIVVFNDGSGRFGSVAGNSRARLMHKWEPNEAQMLEIQQGLQVNSRGSKTKSLRGSPKRGYKSSSASRSVSAMIVSYQETWSIDDPSRLPVFTRDDALGTESALATQGDGVASGRTRYATLAISEDGDVLTGTYSRDENKKGTFKLVRAGTPRGIESDGRTPNERMEDRFREQIRQEVRRQATGEEPSEGFADAGGPRVRPFQLGMKLPQILEAVKAPSTSVNASVNVQKLEVVRIGPEGVEPLDSEDVQSGKLALSDEADYGVLVLRNCSSRESQPMRTSWYLLQKNSLIAWDHVHFHEFCTMQDDYNPAWPESAALERTLTRHLEQSFPGTPQMQISFYQRGLALVRAGRIEDAEQMLARADETTDSMIQGLPGSGLGRDRHRVASASDRDAMRERLVRSIETAKREGPLRPEPGGE